MTVITAGEDITDEDIESIVTTINLYLRGKASIGVVDYDGDSVAQEEWQAIANKIDEIATVDCYCEAGGGSPAIEGGGHLGCGNVAEGVTSDPANFTTGTMITEENIDKLEVSHDWLNGCSCNNHEANMSACGCDTDCTTNPICTCHLDTDYNCTNNNVCSNVSYSIVTQNYTSVYGCGCDEYEKACTNESVCSNNTVCSNNKVCSNNAYCLNQTNSCSNKSVCANNTDCTNNTDGACSNVTNCTTEPTCTNNYVCSCEYNQE